MARLAMRACSSVRRDGNIARSRRSCGLGVVVVVVLACPVRCRWGEESAGRQQAGSDWQTDRAGCRTRTEDFEANGAMCAMCGICEWQYGMKWTHLQYGGLARGAQVMGKLEIFRSRLGLRPFFALRLWTLH